MTKSILIALAAAAMVAIPATCASTAATTTKAAKTAHRSTRDMWPAETLSGKITMVDPASHLVVVQDSSGVPFDIVVNRSTHIKSASGALKLDQLNSDLNRSASIKFVPEGRGDIAETIDVQQ
jgi:hypothetical protein